MYSSQLDSFGSEKIRSPWEAGVNHSDIMPGDVMLLFLVKMYGGHVPIFPTVLPALSCLA